MERLEKVSAKPPITDTVRAIARQINQPLLNRDRLAKTFKEPPKAMRDLPAFYMDHIKSLFKDPKRLRLALSDVTPLSALGLATTVPALMGANKLFPHRKLQNIAGMVGNVTGGQMMQRTGLIGGLLGALTGETLGRTMAMPFERKRRRTPDISTALNEALETQIGRGRRAASAMDSVLSRAETKLGSGSSTSKFYHGSPHKIDELHAGAYVTPHKADAAVFGVPWDSNELVGVRDYAAKDGRPPKRLRFKQDPPADHPVHVYEVEGPVEKALTNTGVDHGWNRKLTEPAKARLVRTIPSWHNAFLDQPKSRAKFGELLKRADMAEAQTVGPRVQTTEPNIGGQFPAHELQDVPEEQWHERNVSGRGETQPEDYLFIKRLLTSLTGGIGANQKDPAGQIDSLHEDPEGWDPTMPTHNAISTRQVTQLPSKEHPEIP